MTNHHGPANHVTFTLDAKEFQLLTALMAPLCFDESEGNSIWVASPKPGIRQWVVRDDDDRYAVARNLEASDTRFNFGDDETGWSYPVPESILMCIGKLSAIDGFTPITLTLSDAMVTVSQADVELSIPQNHKVVAPPIVPAIDTAAAVVVNAAQLWCVVSEARRWPASGDCTGMNPPMRCTVGPDSQQMTIIVDWTTEKNGICTYRLPAQWVHQGRLVEEPVTFTMPITPILTVVRDPMNAETLGDLTMSIPAPGGTHVVLHNESFEFHAPVVTEDTHWGQDLGDVLGDTHFRWVNAGQVMVWPDDFDEGPIKLSRLPSDPQSPYQYRASVVVCDDIIPNVDLYNEVNAINANASGGYRLVVSGNKVVAMSDYTLENYKELGRHMDAFAKGVTGVGKLLGPLTVQFTK